MLNALVQAQDAIARLEAATEVASGAVREGAGARLAFREASGWLAHQGVWVHPVDLALRAAGITGSVEAGRLGVRLPSILPATAVRDGGGVDDRDVTAALRHAVVTQRLRSLRTWSPELSVGLPAEDGTPALLAAVRLVAAGGGARFSADSVLAAAVLWRGRGGTGDPGLPVWSAPVGRLQQAALAADPVPVLLGAIAEAALGARRELARLVAVEARGREVGVTVRSSFGAALEVVLRRPVVTARMVGEAIGVSPRAGSMILDRMRGAGLLREATGRKSWRAFVIAWERL